MFESRWNDVVYRLGYLSTPSLYHKRKITYIYIKPFLTDSESLWLWVLIVIVRLMWWIMLWVQDRNTAVITQDWSSSWSCFCPAADGSELSKHSVTSNIHPYSRLDPHFKRRVSIHPDEIFTQSPEICDRMFFACLLCLLRSIIYRDQHPKEVEIIFDLFLQRRNKDLLSNAMKEINRNEKRSVNITKHCG